MKTVCYLCQDCGNYLGLLPNGDPNPDHCDCDTDMRSWRKMSERDCYRYHQGDGVDCECDSCYEFQHDKSNWNEDGSWRAEL